MAPVKKIGVLALQGSVAEHLAILEVLPQISALPVKTPEDLHHIHGLILPGGESTTIGKLLRIFGLQAPLQALIASGLPVWGTCAGAILLAKEVCGETARLGSMDIAIRRNAFGTQLDSFRCAAPVAGISGGPLPMVFIRAPWIEKTWGRAYPLAEVKGHIVAARQDNLLVTSFHPELTDDLRMHRFFADMVLSQPQ